MGSSDPGIKPESLALAGGVFTTSTTWEAPPYRGNHRVKILVYFAHVFLAMPCHIRDLGAVWYNLFFHVSCGILFPPPEMKPVPPDLGAQF